MMRGKVTLEIKKISKKTRDCGYIGGSRGCAGSASCRAVAIDSLFVYCIAKRLVCWESANAEYIVTGPPLSRA